MALQSPPRSREVRARNGARRLGPEQTLQAEAAAFGGVHELPGASAAHAAQGTTAARLGQVPGLRSAALRRCRPGRGRGEARVPGACGGWRATHPVLLHPCRRGVPGSGREARCHTGSSLPR
ncbi:unnamed protein product, partial [Effrenium voratum]